mgnify:CR=1 FL=1
MKQHLVFSLILLGAALKIVAAVPLALATWIDTTYQNACTDMYETYNETKNSVKEVYKEIYG